MPQVCIEAMHKAVDDQAKAETFHGYGPEQGYSFLTEAIIKNNYTDRGIEIAPDEIFVSDGSKSDCGNIQEIFGTANKVAITDPVYPSRASSTCPARPRTTSRRRCRRKKST